MLTNDILEIRAIPVIPVHIEYIVPRYFSTWYHFKTIFYIKKILLADGEFKYIAIFDFYNCFNCYNLILSNV